MTESHFIPPFYTKTLSTGSITCSAPSNIALVKYWGKMAEQIPKNPSISFTLSNCKTITTLQYSKKSVHDSFSYDVFLDGLKKNDFKPKIETFFKRVEPYLPFLKHYHLNIETLNTFPHSSGIASSASGMSALALCLMCMEQQLLEAQMSQESYIQKASFLARLGSGSACRSVEGELVVWGTHQDIKGSSNLYGITYPYKIHDNFMAYQDTILLVDEGEKQVSSTLGHNLMQGHPFAESRFKQARTNLKSLIEIFRTGNIKAFIDIVESEALSLHAMMMTSMPNYILIKPNTLKIINAIWEFRERTGSNVCFTLDAGANVHVLFPKNESEAVQHFIATELSGFCQNGKYINDEVGLGYKILENSHVS